MLTGIATWIAAKMWGRWLIKIGNGVAAAFKWALSDWRHLVIAAASLFAAYNYVSANKWQARHEKAQATLTRRDKTIADMVAASEAAQIAQIAANKSVTDKQTQIERLNRETAKLQTIAIRDASARYADNNRLRKVCPSLASATNPAAQDSAAKGHDGLQADSILLSAADFELLNARTADAIRYEDWARSLVGAGLAVEGD
jgi:hypothetical protein